MRNISSATTLEAVSKKAASFVSIRIVGLFLALGVFFVSGSVALAGEITNITPSAGSYAVPQEVVVEFNYAADTVIDPGDFCDFIGSDTAYACSAEPDVQGTCDSGTQLGSVVINTPEFCRDASMAFEVSTPQSIPTIWITCNSCLLISESADLVFTEAPSGLDTSGIVAASVIGFESSGSSIYELLEQNLGTILIVAGILLAIGVAWRLFRRMRSGL